MPDVTFFDMFAGIGGFRSGLERAGGFRCIGHCEIDPHADKSYRAIHKINPKEVFYQDAKNIDPDKMPDFNVLCAGFPCQSFSIAGKRRGFEDARGTLFFDIARILKARHPEFFILENVPGLLSHDGGRTFNTILSTLSDLGYGVEWQGLNSKDFGVPQSRKRVYIVGYLNPECAGKIFPFTETTGQTTVQIVGGAQGSRIYDAGGVACTQLSSSGGGGGKTGLYLIRNEKGRQEKLYPIDLYPGEPKVTEIVRCLTSHCGSPDIPNRKGERSGVLLIKEATAKGYKEAAPGDSFDTSFAGQNMKRGRVGKGIANTLTTNADKAVVESDLRVRRLTPRECLRLQGFRDDQIDRLLAVTSDSQAYKQAGNAVTVNVVEAVGRRLYQTTKFAQRGAKGAKLDSKPTTGQTAPQTADSAPTGADVAA